MSVTCARKEEKGEVRGEEWGREEEEEKIRGGRMDKGEISQSKTQIRLESQTAVT